MRISSWIKGFLVVRAESGVTTLVSSVDGKVEGSLSARTSRYRWSRPVFGFILLSIVGLALGGAPGESFTRLWCRCQQRWRIWMSWTSLEAFVEMLRACSLIFRVKTFLRLIGGAAMTALTSYPSWRRRFKNHVDVLYPWRAARWVFEDLKLEWRARWKLSSIFMY
jgi:hypothetical protein